MIFLIRYSDYRYCQGTKDTVERYALVTAGSYVSAMMKISTKYPDAHDFENCTIDRDFEGIQLNFPR